MEDIKLPIVDGLRVQLRDGRFATTVAHSTNQTYVGLVYDTPTELGSKRGTLYRATGMGNCSSVRREDCAHDHDIVKILSRLTLPLKAGQRVICRNGEINTVTDDDGYIVRISNGHSLYSETGRGNRRDGEDSPHDAIADATPAADMTAEDALKMYRALRDNPPPIDWSKPVEGIRTDGSIVAVTRIEKSSHPDYAYKVSFAEAPDAGGMEGRTHRHYLENGKHRLDTATMPVLRNINVTPTTEFTPTTVRTRTRARKASPDQNIRELFLVLDRLKLIGEAQDRDKWVYQNGKSVPDMHFTPGERDKIYRAIWLFKKIIADLPVASDLTETRALLLQDAKEAAEKIIAQAVEVVAAKEAMAQTGLDRVTEMKEEAERTLQEALETQRRIFEEQVNTEVEARIDEMYGRKGTMTRKRALALQNKIEWVGDE